MPGLNGPDETHLAAELATLRDAVSEVLRAVPGTVELRQFGSIAQGTGDGYSDLDLQLFSHDPEMSVAALLPVLHHNTPLEAIYRFETGADTWAAALLFAGTSLFHKIDLGIRPVDSRDAWIASTPSSTLWVQQEPPEARSPSLVPCMAFQPTTGSHDHFVLGALLGMTRYVKARRRGQVLSCWRFAAALAHATMSLRMAIASHRPVPGSTMPTEHFKLADALLPLAEREAMLRFLDFSTPDAMDEAVRRCAGDLMDQVRKAESGTFPDSLATRFKEFCARL